MNIRKLTREEIVETIKPLFGKPCCRKQVGLIKSLGLGFGKKVFLESSELRDRLKHPFRGEWEIGTWNLCSWRISRENIIICDSNDSSEIEKLDSAVEKIDFGHIVELLQPNDFDVRAIFDNGIYVDFFATVSDRGEDEDDTFHVFCPNNIFVAYYAGQGWAIKKSNVGRMNKPKEV